MIESAQAAVQDDEQAREAIRTRLDETQFVEAGAGTGKTRALVDRFCALVEAGRPAAKLVAITFTEKAAAELRDRIRSGLEARLEAGSASAGAIEAALAELDQAQISTIHAFCQAQLRFLAVSAGIDPAFEVLDEVAAGRRFEMRWRSFLEAVNDAEEQRAINRAPDLGLTTRNIEELARELWYRTELAERLEGDPPAPPPDQPLDLESLRHRLAALDPGRAPPEDRLRQKIERTLAFIEALIQAPEEREPLLAAGAATLLRELHSGWAANWRHAGSVTRVREETAAACEALDAALTTARAQALAGLLRVAVRFVLEDAHARAREGALVFDDLILRVRDALRDSSDARRRLRRRYDAMLIDEFQDTDPLQAEIASLFAQDPDTLQVEPGRLFLVGDPKQSVYRFRKADMAVYHRTRVGVLEGGGKELVLSENRRSTGGVLRWVNEVFARVIGGGDQPELQPPYRPVAAQRGTLSLAGPAVSWFGTELEEPAREVRRREAWQVAAACRHVVEEGWQVQERSGETRSATFRDIAVLLPSRTVLQALERALADAGVPYRVEGGSLVYATQEVRDLVNCLTAIDDPTDEVATVAALRSVVYACSDVELAEFRLLHHGSFNYLAPLPDGAPARVAAGLQDLKSFHDQRSRGRIAGLIERFAGSRRIVEAGIYDSGGRNTFRRVRFLVEQARAFEASGVESLRSFVEWLERRAREAVLDQEGAALDDDEDAVRILTVHAAKGLEFPIVLLAGLSVAPRWDTPVFSDPGPAGEVAVVVGTKKWNNRMTLGKADRASDREREHAIAERNRLLYVAATRARDHLVVSLYNKAGTKESAAACLTANGARELAAELPELLPVTGAAYGSFEGLVIEEPELDEPAFEARRAAAVAGARVRVATSATALKRTSGGGPATDGEKPERDDDSEPWSRGRAATHLGRAVHAALQSLRWQPDEALVEATARAQAVAEAVPDRVGEVANLVRRALASEAASRARDARRALREVPFAFRHGRQLVEGYIDLVIETDAGLEVVDWKTDHISASEIPERLRDYELQAGLYVLGLQEATGRRVERVTYVFVSAGAEGSPGEPHVLAAMALQRLTEEEQRLAAPL